MLREGGAGCGCLWLELSQISAIAKQKLNFCESLIPTTLSQAKSRDFKILFQLLKNHIATPYGLLIQIPSCRSESLRHSFPIHRLRHIQSLINSESTHTKRNKPLLMLIPLNLSLFKLSLLLQQGSHTQIIPIKFKHRLYPPVLINFRFGSSMCGSQGRISTPCAIQSKIQAINGMYVPVAAGELLKRKVIEIYNGEFGRTILHGFQL